MRKLTLMILCSLTLVSGCASLDQQNTLGANSNRDAGFSGFGVNRAKYLEGPLTDMMVPDNSPKGRTDLAAPIAIEDRAYRPERVLRFRGQETNRMGEKIVDVRPGFIHEDYLLRDNPHMNHNPIPEANRNLSLEEEIKSRIFAIEKITQVYVASHDDIVLIGVESNEMNRRKLNEELKRTIQDIINENENIEFKITTDRQHVQRVRELDLGTLMLDTPMGR